MLRVAGYGPMSVRPLHAPSVGEQLVTQRDTFTATFCGSGARYGGATVRRARDAVHLDLAAVDVTGDTVTVTGAVGPGITQYVLGTWSTKRACSTGRHGCVSHGYELDDVVRSWPDGAYEYGEHDFVDLAPVRVQVLDAGGGAALVGQIRGFLTEYPIVEGGQAQTKRPEIQVLYRARWDRIRAWSIAARLKRAGLGARWTVAQWPEAPEAFVVAVGGG